MDAEVEAEGVPGPGAGARTPRRASRRGAERRVAILDAALRLFRREGFHATGVAAICREAGVSPGHLYHFFPSKEAIVEAIVDGDRARVAEIVAELAAAPEPLEALIAGLLGADEAEMGLALDATLAVEVLAEAARNPAVAAILARHDAEARAAIAGLVADGQSRGAVAAGVDPAGAAEVLLALSDALLGRRAGDPGGDHAALRAALGAMMRAYLGAGHGGRAP